MGIISVLETISHQRDDYGKDIEDIFSILVEKVKATGSRISFNTSDEIKEIESKTFKRLGIRIKMITDGHLASVIPYFPSEDHIFINEQIRKSSILRDQADFRKRHVGKKGTVDLKQAHVGGTFSDYESPLFLNIAELVLAYELDAGEVTAIFLHEIGHVFSTYEYSVRQDKTYERLQDISNRLLKGKDVETVKYVHTELRKIGVDIDEKKLSSFVDGGTSFLYIVNTVISALVIESVIKYNHLLANKDVSSEDSADSFASRFGYGLKLQSARSKRLDTKISRYPPLVYLWKASECFIGATFVITAIVGPAPALYAVLPLFPPALLFYIVFTYMRISDENEGTGRGFVDRYKEVRSDCIELLKTKDLDRGLVRSTLDTIYSIDAIVKSGDNSLFGNSFNKMIDEFFFSRNRYLDSNTGRDILRDLSNNDLFISSAKIRTLKD